MAEKSVNSAMPRFDLDMFVAMQRANLETFAAAQRIMLDLAQTVARRQTEMVKDNMGRFEAMMKGFDAKKQPQTYVDGMKEAVERAMADARETMDLGMKAQSEVVELFVKRTSANLEDARRVAA